MAESSSRPHQSLRHIHTLGISTSDRLLLTLNDINAESRTSEELERSTVVQGPLTRLYLLTAQTPDG
ncbi:hypothetical protein [Sorangium sp. So ce128]|uniref:hypothetical protein n=1 Tax=Sorangium sp. So ce128 TaxID=3133281 RepID=UPI003F62C54C